MNQKDVFTLIQDSQREQVLNPYHQKLLIALQSEEELQITVNELCRKAGVSRATWNKAMKTPQFAAVVRSMGIKIGSRGARYLQESVWFPTIQEQKLLDSLQREEQEQISIKDLCQKAGVSISTWEKAIKKSHFAAVVEVSRVKVGNHGLGHIQVSITTNPEEELAKDIWDTRCLKPDYPKHKTPATFKVDFTWIKNPLLRQQVKGYFRQNLPKWKPGTFRTLLMHMRPFLRLLPPEIHIGILERTLVEELLPQICQLNDRAVCICLRHMRKMLDYMATSPAWPGERPPRFLIRDADIPSEPDTLPRPIPPDVLQQLDTLLKQAIQMMEDTQEPHILKSVFWHALLILRRTGIRFEDLAHLKAPDDHGRNGCLRQDSEGYWWLRLEHKMNKTSRDCLIPTKMSDGVVAAVQRQQERVKDIPNHFDENYLFRNQKGVLSYNTFRDALAKKLAPHLTHEGQPYTITPHQFRHTIATDMIEQGVDIYTIKEFLGHARLHTTERYIEVYHTILKARYDAYRAKKQEQEISIPALAMDQIQVSPSEDKADGGWVNGQEGQFYLSPLPNGIGNCTHPATQEACPNPPFCPTCPKLRASARHLAAWENKATNLMITVEALRTNPAYARARQRHEQELQHTQKVVQTIKQEGFWDGHLHGSR